MSATGAGQSSIKPGTRNIMAETDKSRIEGEGSYTGAKQYNEATRRFVEEGKVDQAAADAAPDNTAEAAEMAAAEQAGKRKAREEDPALSGAPVPEDDSDPAGGGGDQGGAVDRPDAGDLE
jgi:hypothetical protein